MTDRFDYAEYIRDVVYLLREAADEARKSKNKTAEGKQFHEGRESALIEVLLMMQSRADSFALPRNAIGLDAFDPLKDPLAPPKPNRDL